jgi:hypothetical protein
MSEFDGVQQCGNDYTSKLHVRPHYLTHGVLGPKGPNHRCVMFMVPHGVRGPKGPNHRGAHCDVKEAAWCSWTEMSE